VKKHIGFIAIATLILAGALVWLPMVISCSNGGDSEIPEPGINMGEESLLGHISRLETTSANKSAQIKGLNDEVYALEIENVNLALENESLRSHIKGLPGEAGYRSITQAWEVCQEQLQEALSYKVTSTELSEKLTELSKTWKERRAILIDRVEYFELALEKVNDRVDPTTTSNLTAEKRANFYELWDIWYETLD